MHVKRHVGHLWHWPNFVSVKTLNFHIFCMRLNVVNCKLKTDFFLSKYNSVFGYHSNDPSSFSLKTSVKAWQNEKLFWVACGNVTQPHLLNQGQFCLRVKCLKGCLVMEIKSLSVSRILPPTLTVCLHHVVMPRNDRRHFFLRVVGFLCNILYINTFQQQTLQNIIQCWQQSYTLCFGWRSVGNPGFFPKAGAICVGRGCPFSFSARVVCDVLLQLAE
jgi:hypothetical protein